jgi:hypothetical protein
MSKESVPAKLVRDSEPPYFAEKVLLCTTETTVESLHIEHRVATFHHDGKISPGGGCTMHIHPPFTIPTITYNVAACTLQLRWQIHFPLYCIWSVVPSLKSGTFGVYSIENIISMMTVLSKAAIAASWCYMLLSIPPQVPILAWYSSITRC